MSDPLWEDPDAAKARGWRNLVLGVALALFVVLVFVVTLVRLGNNVAAVPS
jgi:hypothetical protein